MAKIPIDFSDFTDRVAGDSQISSTSVFAERIDLLRMRASFLSGKDKTLMEMYLDRGISFQQMANIAGVSRAKISRRINKLIKCLLGTEFVKCLRNNDLLTQQQLDIALDYYVGGLSRARIAGKRDITKYHVKKTLGEISEIISGDNPSTAKEICDGRV